MHPSLSISVSFSFPTPRKLETIFRPAASLWIQRPGNFVIPLAARIRRASQQLICALTCTDYTRTQNDARPDRRKENAYASNEESQLGFSSRSPRDMALR